MITSYQVMVEGVFIHAPALGEELGGFHATFFVKANGAVNAAHRARGLLLERMNRHGITKNDAKVLKTYYWVHDLWEITEEKLSKEEFKDAGFTFFRIGKFENIYLAVRRWFFQRFKPWLLISI